MGDKYNMIFFLIVILNSLIQILSDKHIIIPLYYLSNTDENSNYIKFLFEPQLYAKIKLGYPEQTSYLLISTDNEYFSIESDNINPKFFNSNKSSTFTNSNNKHTYYSEKYKSSSTCTDQFYFINDIKTMKEESYKNLSFDYIYELSEVSGNNKEKNSYLDKDKNELSGIIGLQFPKPYSNNNFLKRLTDIGAISKNIWSIKFIESKPYLILGENPYEENYKESKRTNCYIKQYYQYWYFLFNDIKVGNIKFNEERIAEYSPQFGAIIGSIEYKNYIKKNFFDGLINNGKCLEKNVTMNNKIYSYYECDNDIDLNNFEEIEFIHQELSYKFILDKNDLFADFKGKKYFLCIFLVEDLQHSYLTSKNWILGTPFIKKYNFVFNEDSKIILFYEQIEKIIENGEINDKNNEYSSLSIGIIIFLSIFTGLLIIYLIVKSICKPKQIKANELEDSFRYNNQGNMNNKDIMNSFSNSKYSQLGV